MLAPALWIFSSRVSVRVASGCLASVAAESAECLWPGGWVAPVATTARTGVTSILDAIASSGWSSFVGDAFTALPDAASTGPQSLGAASPAAVFLAAPPATSVRRRVAGAGVPGDLVVSGAAATDLAVWRLCRNKGHVGVGAAACACDAATASVTATSLGCSDLYAESSTVDRRFDATSALLVTFLIDSCPLGADFPAAVGAAAAIVPSTDAIGLGGAGP